jgi:hypothetical protein
LAALVCPVQKYFFLTIHFFNSLVPISHLAGQAVVLGFLSLSMCLCLSPSPSKLGRQSCWVARLLLCVSGGAAFLWSLWTGAILPLTNCSVLI